MDSIKEQIDNLKSMATHVDENYLGVISVLPSDLRKWSESLEKMLADNEAMQEQIDALQQKVHLCTAYDKMLAENERLKDKLHQIENWCKA